MCCKLLILVEIKHQQVAKRSTDHSQKLEFQEHRIVFGPVVSLHEMSNILAVHNLATSYSEQYSTNQKNKETLLSVGQAVKVC